MSFREVSLLLVVIACAEPGKKNTPEGPQIAEAPPTSDTEATAPPQPAPELGHPASPEAKTAQGAPPPRDPPTTPVDQVPTPPPGKAGAPTIGKGKIEVAGPGKLDPEVVTRYLNKNSANLQGCYEKALLGNPAIEGDITLVFDIDANGAVTNAKTMGNMNDVVEKCVIATAQRIVFPKPANGSVNVSYPLTFGWK
jgi:hypothetical protein